MTGGVILPGVAFVTGGGRGLGLAVACAYAQEGATAVVLVDIHDEKTMSAAKEQVEALGAKCLSLKCDVTKESDIESAVAQTVEKFGRLDYAANFAGISGGAVMTLDANGPDFEKVMAVNATGVMLCTKHQMRQMIKQEPLSSDGPAPQRGAIVNCASMNASMSMPGSLAYTASKHAVNGITKTAALEGRRQGVRVNAVSPGFLRTSIVQEGLDAGAINESIWGKFEARQGRIGQPSEIGNAVVLMSSQKMSLVNGQNLNVDGGFTINEYHE